MAEFPNAIPTNRQSSTSEYLSNMASSFGHVALHNFEVSEIIALATKLGTGSSTPTSGAVLKGTGAGASAWGQVDLATEIGSFTSADLRGRLSDETGTGSSVFATSPTISAPVFTGGGTWAGSPVLSTPAIADLTNATHTHQNSAGGGTLNGAAAIQDGTITPAELATGTGTSWAYQTWVPVFTNFTTGDGSTNYAKYLQVGKTVFFELGFTLGGTSVVSGEITFTLPITSVTYNTNASPIGIVTILDSGTAFIEGKVVWVTTTTAKISPSKVDGVYGNFVATSSSEPMTWTTNDGFYLTGRYEAA